MRDFLMENDFVFFHCVVLAVVRKFASKRWNEFLMENNCENITQMKSLFRALSSSSKVEALCTFRASISTLLRLSTWIWICIRRRAPSIRIVIFVRIETNMVIIIFIIIIPECHQNCSECILLSVARASFYAHNSTHTITSRHCRVRRQTHITEAFMQMKKKKRKMFANINRLHTRFRFSHSQCDQTVSIQTPKIPHLNQIWADERANVKKSQPLKCVIYNAG